MKNSTRLFNCRPSRVLFVAKGCCFPIGMIWINFPMPDACRVVATVKARFLERFTLYASSPMESVCPTIKSDLSAGSFRMTFAKSLQDRLSIRLEEVGFIESEKALCFRTECETRELENLCLGSFPRAKRLRRI